MYISSLYAFTRFLAPEDVPYVFTFDNTGKMPHFLSWRTFYIYYYKYVEYPDPERNRLVRTSRCYVLGSKLGPGILIT